MATTTKVDDEVIENINANDDAGAHTNAIELDEVQPTTKPEVNGNSNNNNSNNNSNYNDTSKNKGPGGPMQYPKIFIALMVVLIIAVIALSFVLHSLSSRVDKTEAAEESDQKIKTKLTKLESKITELTEEKDKLEKRLKNITTVEERDHNRVIKLDKTQKTVVDKQKNVINKLDEHSNTLTKVGSDIKAQKNNLKQVKEQVEGQSKVSGQLQKNLTLTDTNVKAAALKLASLRTSVSANNDSISNVKTDLRASNKAIGGLKKNASQLTTMINQNAGDIKKHGTGIKSMNATIQSNKNERAKLEKKLDGTDMKLNATNEKITALKNQTGKLEKKVENNTKSVTEVTGLFHQLNMKIQYNETLEKKIGLRFKEILDLTGEVDKVEKTEAVITKLLEQRKQFDEHNKKWKISIKDVARLTDGDELKGAGKLLTIKKLSKLYEGFGIYNKNWSIKFQDLIRLTTKKDMKDIPCQDGSNSIAILERLNQLFKAFTPYKKLWKIHFQDIVDLTKDLNFEDAAKSPVFVKVKSWYVPGFKDVWGDSFDGFFHIMKENPAKQSEFLGKVKSIADKENKQSFMKMLPGTFQYDGKTFSVHGYIKVFYGGRNGTVWMKGKKKGFNFQEGAATALCHLGGYGETFDGWSNGKYRDGKGIDRSNMRCFLSGLRCYGDEEILSKCQMDDIVDPTTSPPTTTTITTTPKLTTQPIQSTPKPTTQPKTTTQSKATTHREPQSTTQHKLRQFILLDVLQSWDHSEDVAIKCNF